MASYGAEIMPAGHYETITPHASNDFTSGECEGIWVGGAGVLQVVRPDGTAVAFTAVAGSVLPVRAIRVNAVATTATLLVALYNRK
jgi:hypothetical protein